MTMMRKGFIFLVVITCMVSCSGQFRNHGYMPPIENVNALVIGLDTQESVVEALGSPSTGGMLTDQAVYYVRNRVHHRGYTKPNEVSREVLLLTFDEKKTLSNVQRFGIDEGKIIQLEHRVTEVSGVERNILQQIIGSIGGFNPSAIVDE